VIDGALGETVAGIRRSPIDETAETPDLTLTPLNLGLVTMSINALPTLRSALFVG